MTIRQSLFAGCAMLSLSGIAAHAQDTAPATPVAPAPADAPPAPAPYTPPAAVAPTEPAVAPAPAPDPAAAPSETTPVAPADNAAAAVAPGDDAPLAAATALTTLVEDVQVVGPWMDGDRTGIWRTVMMQVGTPEKEVYRFFIQQIEKVGAVQTILSTTEIKEIPEIDGAIVGYRADEPTEGETKGLTLFFDIVPSDGEIAETYELHFQMGEPYTFGPATN